MQSLKLIAMDAEDLAIISAHLQDACVKIEEMAYLPRQQRFAAVINRFDWERAIKCPESVPDYKRCRAGLRFERVLGAQLHGVNLDHKGEVLCLLAVQFDPVEPPGGFVHLVFAGGPMIRLQVECIEAELKDLGPAWPTNRKPDHRRAEHATAMKTR
jgi:hypothetical protein